MSDGHRYHDKCKFSYRVVDNTSRGFIIYSYLCVAHEEVIMLRFARYLVRRLLFFIAQLAQLFQVLRRFVYVLFLFVSSFLVQLHICLYIGDHSGILEITPENGFYPLYDWSKHAERFLICCGAFLWLVYILPNRQGISPWAKGAWAQRSPFWVGFCHAGCWMLIWGPLANAYTLYEGMSSFGILACLVVLAEVYYVQVWQDIVVQIRQTQKIQAENKRFAQTTRYV